MFLIYNLIWNEREWLCCKRIDILVVKKNSLMLYGGRDAIIKETPDLEIFTMECS